MILQLQQSTNFDWHMDFFQIFFWGLIFLIFTLFILYIGIWTKLYVDNYKDLRRLQNEISELRLRISENKVLEDSFLPKYKIKEEVYLIKEQVLTKLIVKLILFKEKDFDLSSYIIWLKSKGFNSENIIENLDNKTYHNLFRDSYNDEKK